MKKISQKEQKELLVEMLEYIDNLCRMNNIKYSLIGGSLIGAIRHKGFIPWDDDIDIILDLKNYEKLVDILKQENEKSNYKAFIPQVTPNYYLQFVKLINKKTSLQHENCIDHIDGYGLFLDIFCYNNISSDENKRKKEYKKIVFLNNCLYRIKTNYNNPNLLTKIKRVLKNFFIGIYGRKRILNIIIKKFNKYNKIESNYIISNNPVYGCDKEIQFKENIQDYIDVKFENIIVMIFKNYDNILNTTFGDYMQLPPKEKRINHNMNVYWKDN